MFKYFVRLLQPRSQGLSSSRPRSHSHCKIFTLTYDKETISFKKIFDLNALSTDDLPTLYNCL